MRTVNRGIFAIEKAGENGKTVGMSFDQIILFSTIAMVSFSIRSIPILRTALARLALG